jgi:hypothetical protein
MTEPKSAVEPDAALTLRQVRECAAALAAEAAGVRDALADLKWDNDPATLAKFARALRIFERGLKMARLTVPWLEALAEFARAEREAEDGPDGPDAGEGGS